MGDQPHPTGVEPIEFVVVDDIIRIILVEQNKLTEKSLERKSVNRLDLSLIVYIKRNDSEKLILSSSSSSSDPHKIAFHQPSRRFLLIVIYSNLSRALCQFEAIAGSTNRKTLRRHRPSQGALRCRHFLRRPRRLIVIVWRPL